MTFSVVGPEGNQQAYIALRDDMADWAKAGIIVRFAGGFDGPLPTGPCTESMSSCGWEISDISGWLYEPDYEPSGEYLFGSGSIYNDGSYSDQRNDSLINQSIASSSDGALETWAGYATDQLPVLWQPSGAELVEVSKHLAGVLPVSSIGAIEPELWRAGAA
ncbi:MAG: hypothetical protein ACRD0Z_13125 [Acidimicrobiales bacterium]